MSLADQMTQLSTDLGLLNSFIHGSATTTVDLGGGVVIPSLSKWLASIGPTFAASVFTIAGTAANPAYSFTGDPNTGIYNVGADAIGFSCGGTLRAMMNATGIGVSGITAPQASIHVGGGAAAMQMTNSVTDAQTKQAALSVNHYLNAQFPVLAIAGQMTSGNNSLYIGGGLFTGLTAATIITLATAANNTTVSSSAIPALVINNSQQCLTTDGSASAPSQSFISDTNTGFYRPGTDILAGVNAGAESFRVIANKHFLIGTTVDNAVLTVGGNVAPEADNARSNGLASFRWSTVFSATGAINTSDAREKSKIADIIDGSAIVRAIAPKSFEKYDQQRMGFLAQDVRRGLAQFGIGMDTVQGDEKVDKLGLYEPDLIAPLWASQRQVLARLDALESSQYARAA